MKFVSAKFRVERALRRTGLDARARAICSLAEHAVARFE